MANTTTPRLHTQYIIRTSSAKMPSRCWGRYAHVGVLAVHGKYTAQLRDTASQELVWYRGRLFDGTSDRCARARAEDRAVDVVRSLERCYREQLTAGYLASVATRSTADEL